MKMSERIKNLRVQNGFTQSQLGKAIGVTKVSISGYESGNRIPELNTVIKLADIFEVSMDYLIGREEKEHYNDLLKDDHPPYIYYGYDDIEELSYVEARRLREELEMYRLYQLNQKK